MTLGIIIAIIALFVAAASGFLIKRQSLIIKLNRSIQKTLDSIKQGRNCKIAIIEDFHEHERLALDLLPYLLFNSRSRTESALRNYNDLYNKKYQDNILNLLGADWQSEIDEILKHLTALIKKR